MIERCTQSVFDGSAGDARRGTPVEHCCSQDDSSQALTVCPHMCMAFLKMKIMSDDGVESFWHMP